MRQFFENKIVVLVFYLQKYRITIGYKIKDSLFRFSDRW